MSISSHLGIILLVIVGVITIVGVVIIAVIETRRVDNESPPMPPKATELPTGRKRGEF